MDKDGLLLTNLRHKVNMIAENITLFLLEVRRKVKQVQHGNALFLHDLPGSLVIQQHIGCTANK